MEGGISCILNYKNVHISIFYSSVVELLRVTVMPIDPFDNTCYFDS